MKLRYSLAMEELLNSASELQSFRKEVRREISFFYAQHEDPLGLHPERFISRLDELERRFETSLMVFLSATGMLQVVRSGKPLTARRPAM
jgi:hypothetical protein